MVPLFGAPLRSPKTLLNPPVNGKFKDFSSPLSVFQGKFYFQGLIKTVLYIQVLLKPVRTLYCNEATADVLKFQTVIACQKGIGKQHRPRSEAV